MGYHRRGVREMFKQVRDMEAQAIDSSFIPDAVAEADGGQPAALLLEDSNYHFLLFSLWMAFPGIAAQLAGFQGSGSLGKEILCLLLSAWGCVALGWLTLIWSGMGGARLLWCFNALLSLLMGVYLRLFPDVPSLWTLLKEKAETSALSHIWWELFPYKEFLLFFAIGFAGWQFIPRGLRSKGKRSVVVMMLLWTIAQIVITRTSIQMDGNFSSWHRRMHGFLWNTGRDLGYELLGHPRQSAATFVVQDRQRHIPIGLGHAAAWVPRVLVIQVESLDYNVVHYVSPEVGATAPFLSRLANEVGYSRLNPNHTGTSGSSGADFQFFTGLRPWTPFPAFSDPWFAWQQALPAQLLRRGISTQELHGNVKDFWQRGDAYRWMSVLQFTDSQALPAVPGSRWGIPDLELFQTALRILRGLPPETPHLLHIITLTSHTPFDLVPGMGSERDQLRGTERHHYFYDPDLLANRYLRSIHYTDGAIQTFIESIPQDQEWEVIIYGDHGSGVQGDGYDSYFSGHQESVPGFIFRVSQGRILPLQLDGFPESERTSNHLEIIALHDLVASQMLGEVRKKS